MKLIFLLCFFISTTFADKLINIAYLFKDNDMNANHAKLVTKIISTQVDKIYKKKIFLINRVNSDEELISCLKNNCTELFFLKTSNYIDNIDKYKLYKDDTWSLKLGDYDYEEYYLIRNKELNKKISDLNNEQILYSEVLSNSKLWLESLLIENNSYLKLKHNIIPKRKDYHLVTSVYFNKDILAVVNRSTYETILELNPQLEKKIEVLRKSKNIFVSSLLIMKKNIDEKTKNIIIDSIDIFNKKYNGSGFNTVSKVNLMKIENNSLDKFLRFYIEHKEKIKKLENEN